MNAPQPTPFEVNRSRAHAALLAGQAATAERMLRALAAQYPQEPSIQWLLGAALLAQDQAEASMGVLEPLVERRPSSPARAWTWRAPTARTDSRSGRVHRCSRCSRRFRTTTWPGWPTGTCWWISTSTPMRVTAYERARLTDPQRPRIEAATAALVADDRKGAEGIFRQILQANPSHVAALCGLAAVSLAADKPHDAERLLRHALRQSAHLPLAQRGLGQVLVALGRLTDAEAARAAC